MEEDNKIILSNGLELEKKVYSKYTVDELKEIIKCSKSFIDIIKTLKVNKSYHIYLTKFVKDNNVDISHFERIHTKRTIDKILVKDSVQACSTRIKQYLLKNNIVKEECSVCKIPPEWNNNPLTLQLDHINGDHFDNRVENLRLICPNCHSQTDTFTGRNLREYKEQQCDCGNILKRNQTTNKCAECISKEKHLCSICKINERSKSGTKTRCDECKKNKIIYKKCKGCGEDITRQSNKGEYHKKCFKGKKINE